LLDCDHEHEEARITVAVIGLGDLGLACAARVNEVGLETIGVEASAQRRAIWRQESGREAVGELHGLALDHALVCVRTTAQAREILLELRQCAAGRELATYVLTTLEPAFARQLGDHAGDGLRVIELPVSGGRAAARRGELTVLIGGGQAGARELAFLERTLAQQTFAFPRFGDATLAKLLNNAVAAYNAAAFAACLTLADEAGLGAAVCAEIIGAGSGASWIAEHFEALVDDLLAKDAELLASELGELPAIVLSDPAQLLATLARGRELLA
jgi:3-hydroxyisobutyrate dehydrogenase